MKRIAFSALGLGLAVAVAAPASAATQVTACGSHTDTPLPSAGCAINFNGSTGGAGTYGNPNVNVTPFTDSYSFDLASAGTLGLTLTSIGVSSASTINFTVAKVNAPGDNSPMGTPLASGSAMPGLTMDFLQNFSASAGTYVLTLSGNIADAAPNASYSGTISFAPGATTPMPEPAAWGMMIMGFGLVGGALRRRKTTAAFA